MGKVKRFDATVAGFGPSDFDIEYRPDGAYVDADVAQELYDALDEIIDGKSIYDLSCETGWSPEHCQRWFDILAKARGEA